MMRNNGWSEIPLLELSHGAGYHEIVVKHIKKFGIASGLIVLVVITQTLLYSFFVTALLRGSRSAMEKSEEETFSRLGDAIDASLRDELEFASLMVIPIAADQRIQNSLAANDRETLTEHVASLYDTMNGRITGFHFHRPDGTSLLRIPAMEQRSGEPSLIVRPLIRDCITHGSVRAGIDHGERGTSFRAASPVMVGNTVAGIVEICFDFSDRVISKLSERHEGDFFLYFFDRDGNPFYYSGSRASDRCTLAEASVEQLMAGEQVWSLDCLDARAVALYPFRDYEGAVAGFIKSELHHIPIADTIDAIRTRLVVYGVILLFLLLMSVSFAMKLLLRPLHSVVEQTRDISERILSGDLEFRGDVSAAAPDFQHVITAVNDIIGSLRSREVLLQAIVEGIPGIVFYADMNQTILWANTRAVAMLPDIVGKKLHELPHPFFGHEDHLFDVAFFTGEAAVVEAGIVENGSDRPRYWEHVAVPVCGSDGTVECVIRISRDVSEKHIAESSLRELNETLERRIEEEIERRKEGERIADQQSRLASLGELATGMAHEITQPLNAVSFALENLRARIAAGAVDEVHFRKKMDVITADIERVRRVIDHVRIFARTTPEDHQISFSVAKCVDNALALIGVQLATHGVDVRLKLAESLPDLYGNPYQYEQVILNLLSNARDAIEERMLLDAEADNPDPLPGLVEIGTGYEGGIVVLEVYDNGSGIPDSVRNKVFNPFFSTKKPGKGTGLGLSISYGIISSMGGEISLASVYGGTVARVSVPLPIHEGVSV